MATADVSEPPRPSVVMSPCSSTPWKPATTAIWPFFSVSKIFEPFDGLDARLRERAVGEDLHLVTEERARLAALVLDGHRGERGGDLLAGRGDDVHLARVGHADHLVREAEEAIRLAAHRADDDDDVVALLLRSDGATRDVADAVDRADGRATEFLDDESHESAWFTNLFAVRQRAGRRIGIAAGSRQWCSRPWMGLR